MIHEAQPPKPIRDFLTPNERPAIHAGMRDDAYFASKSAPLERFRPLRGYEFVPLAAAVVAIKPKRKHLVSLLLLSALYGGSQALPQRNVVAETGAMNAAEMLRSPKKPVDHKTVQAKPEPAIELPVITPESVEVAKPYTASLDLTDFWDPYKYEITPNDGSVHISASLFIEKNTPFNYGWREGAPGGISTLMWNSIEAVHEFGNHTLKPGDTLVFADEIDLGDTLLPGETDHGEGYFGTTNGMCNASSALGEIFGATVVLPDGSEVPVFIAKPGAVQPHDMNHNPSYYNYAYHGPGVAVNSTEYGKLEFSVNPSLPESVVVRLGLEFTDTDPSDSYKGLYKPTATLSLEGLPDGSLVHFQRLSANRTNILQRMTGAEQYYLRTSGSAYYNRDGSFRSSDSPIIFSVEQRKKFRPILLEYNSGTSIQSLELERFTPLMAVPKDMVNETFYPGGYAGESLRSNGKIIWIAREEALPLNPTDLPKPISEISADEYLRILRWNNVDDPNNKRYLMEEDGTSFCNIAVADWARAFRLDGEHGAPLPRWFEGQKLSSNQLYDWFSSYSAVALGWKPLGSGSEAADAANNGQFTIAIAKNYNGVGHIVAVAPGVGWTSPDGEFFPNTAQAGQENWGPDAGKTVADSFRNTTPRDWTPVSYYVWSP